MGLAISTFYELLDIRLNASARSPFFLLILGLILTTPSFAVTLQQVQQLVEATYQQECNPSARVDSTTRSQCQALQNSWNEIQNKNFQNPSLQPNTYPPNACQLHIHNHPTLPLPLPVIQEQVSVFWGAFKEFPGVSPISIVNLIQCIENQNLAWKQACIQKKLSRFPSACQSYDKTWAQTDIQLGSECDSIYIEIRHIDLGRGSFKVYHPMLQYKTWKKFASGEILTPSHQISAEKLAEIDNEIQILNQVSHLPKSLQTGLPITLYADRTRIIQKKYDGTLTSTLQHSNNNSSLFPLPSREPHPNYPSPQPCLENTPFFGPDP